MLTSPTLEAKVNTWTNLKAFKLEIKPPSVKPPPIWRFISLEDKVWTCDDIIQDI